jgi:arginase family enzyme
MQDAFTELLQHPAPTGGRPLLVTLGGDHSIALAALRAVNTVLGEPAGGMDGEGGYESAEGGFERG